MVLIRLSAVAQAGKLLNPRSYPTQWGIAIKTSTVHRSKETVLVSLHL